MNLREAFEELENINEAVRHYYKGTYNSPYLNLSEAEIEKAQDDWLDETEIEHVLRGTSIDYATPHERFNSNKCFFILNYDTFHRAYDKAMNELDMLDAFDSNGHIGNKSCYSYYVAAKENNKANEPGAKGFVRLWSKIFKDSMSWWRNKAITQEDLDKIIAKRKQAAEEQRQAALAKEKEKADRQAKEEQDRQALDAKCQELTDLLTQALPKVDSQILGTFKQYSETEISIQPSYWDSKIYLSIPHATYTELTTEWQAKATAENLAKLIEECLKKADFKNKLALKDLGVELIQQTQKKFPNASVTGYFLNPKTKQVYEMFAVRDVFQVVRRDAQKKIIDSATFADLKDYVLAAVKVEDSQTSSRTTVDDHYFRYYSYNEDLVVNSDIVEAFPFEYNTHNMLYNGLDYYDNGFTDASKYHKEFVDFKNFDVWLYEHETHVATD